MIHGLDLCELAACYGLSTSQVDNILKHGHARTNRAVFVKLCAALAIHNSELIKAECPDVKDALDHLNEQDRPPSKSGMATGDSSQLSYCTTSGQLRES